MIKKLRIKFIFVTMSCIGALFVLILLVINIFMTVSSKNQGYEILSNFADGPHFRGSSQKSASKPYREDRPSERPEILPLPDQPGNSYQNAFRIFSISYDADGNVLDVDYNPHTDLEKDDILAIGEKVSEKDLRKTSEKGIVQSQYLYLIRNRETSSEIYFLDYSVEHSMNYRLFYLCLLAGLLGMLVLFAAVFFLSGWIIRPVQNAFELQKQFISDASHELKTPLTIITANGEVLSSSLGKNNKWLNHILEQAARMNTLIRELLDLARLDEVENKPVFVKFDLSHAVSAAALSFESIAFESCKTFRMQIAEGILYRGSEQTLRQLVTILLDNAFKYADENGTVTLTLSAKGEKKILTVHNTGKGIAPEDQKHIFERFYRSDSSRSRDSGGYGLGLSIASSIAELHRGRISVKSDGSSYTQITVIL